MKHLELKDGVIVRSPKQAAKEFLRLHAEEAQANKDMKRLKTLMSPSDREVWFALGINVSLIPCETFDKAAAIALLLDLGATPEQIESLKQNSEYKRVSLVKDETKLRHIMEDRRKASANK